MNSTYFIEHFNELFSSYSPLTNTSVWWFNSLDQQLQTNIVSLLCTTTTIDTAVEGTTIQTNLDALLILNQTFLLGDSVQSAIQECVAQDYGGGRIEAVPPNQSLTEGAFAFNPFTPGSKRWYSEQDEEIQSSAIEFVCANYQHVWNYTPQQSLQVVGYLSANTSEDAIQLMQVVNECVASLKFLQDPVENKLWLRSQTDLMQQSMLIHLCADPNQSTEYMSWLLAFLRQFLSNNPRVQDMAWDCVLTRDSDPKKSFQNYSKAPMDRAMLTWFSSRSLKAQLSAMEYLFEGSSIIDFSVPFRIQDLYQIFKTYLTFLDSLDMSTTPHLKKLDTLLRRYYSYNLSSELTTLTTERALSVNIIWFLSQNGVRQGTAVDEMCSAFDSNQAVTIFGYYWVLLGTALNPVIYKKMISCPQTMKALFQLRLEVYFFIGSSITSALMLIGLVVMVVRKEAGIKALASAFTVSMMISLFILTCQNAVFAYYWSIWLGNFNQVVAATKSTEATCYISILALTSLWDLTYLYVSYIRSREFIREVWPKNFQVIQWVFALSPLLICSPVVVGVFESLNLVGVSAIATWSFQAASDACVLLLDLLLLTTFARFVASLSQYVSDDCRQFEIISWYGGFASIGCALISITSLAKSFLSKLRPDDFQSMHLPVLTRTLLTLVISGILLTMKYQLYREEDRPKSHDAMSNYDLSKRESTNRV
ncbi:hypothetical protein BDR26DRAFT_860465 [Obelidium mucronatum]|nr:hypothetical protein BDR26DRAFT_860465 [Obelidium mucronatum]